MLKKYVKSIPYEQLILVKQIDLLSYLLQYEPNSIIKIDRHYESVTHDGLIITKKKWNWKDKHLSGKCAIDYLVYVEEMPFIDAALLLKKCFL